MRAVDLFAGYGGFTLGAHAAGVPVVWAANHWPLAVEAHHNNFPLVKHVCQDLRQADWSLLPSYDLLLAAPACQGHSQAAQPSRARSDRTRAYHDSLRATAWAVVDCADVTEPRAIVVENVADFRRWRLYGAWRAALETLGYHLQELELTASWHDVPQRRTRLFVIATRSGRHVDVPRADAEAAFGPHVDWDADVEWTPVRSATVRVKERIAKGRRNHGARFLTQHVTGHPGVGLDEPVRTITTKDQWAVVDGRYYRPLTVRENARAMGFPDEYTWPSSATRKDHIKGLGNAVCPPLAAKLITAVKEAA